MAIYTVKLPFDKLRIDADLSNAESGVYYENAFKEWDSTPFQTADVQHDETEMAVTVIRWLGPDYWLDPDDAEPEDEDEYIGDLIESIEDGGGDANDT